ncbi:MAG: type 1 glutamine amidotransferase-like domain-containing protein [Gemmatimonadetes bacterium]|nr:type 1 glutamine amidotransferase-like domain-containing protein [Gemmatimonadota bacterium]
MLTRPRETAAAGPRATNPKQTIVLLGPQTRKETLGKALKDIGAGARIATVTAGWQEREAEIEALQSHLKGTPKASAVNLQLHSRAVEIFENDAEFESVHRLRQIHLRDLQRLYDVRVEHAMAAVAELARRRERSDLAAEEWESAIGTVRALDEEHGKKLRTVHKDYDKKLGAGSHAAVRKHRREIRKILDDCDCLAIAGGHVAVLLNRLRLFGVAEAWKTRPVVGWSAGAMVLTERVIVYHDSPPQGPGNPEVLESGLGLVKGIVALPDARHRLRLDDPERVSRFARRFAPDRCIAMDDGARLTFTSKGWTATPESRELKTTGKVEKVVTK